MLILSVLVIAALLVGLGVMVGSRIAGWWYDSQQSVIEDELRTQLNALRQSRPAKMTVCWSMPLTGQSKAGVPEDLGEMGRMGEARHLG